jgi:hypothetical protein
MCNVRAGLFHADGQTDTTKLIVAFRKFTNALKNDCFETNRYMVKAVAIRRSVLAYTSDVFTLQHRSL